jgi:hypothetical protein
MYLTTSNTNGTTHPGRPCGRRTRGGDASDEPPDALRLGRARLRPRRREIECAALELVARRGREILTTARHYAANLDDAEDAYQRGLEILLTKAPTTRAVELARWLKTVVKHEAFHCGASGRATRRSPTTASSGSGPPRLALSTTRWSAMSGCARPPRRSRSSSRKRRGRCDSRPRATRTRRSAGSPAGPTPKSTAA